MWPHSTAAARRAIRITRLSRQPLDNSPVGRPVVLQELSPNVGSGLEAADYRIQNAGCAVDDIQGRMKALFFALARRDLDRVFIRDPSGVDAVHVNAVAMVVGRRGAGHHVEDRKST